MPTATYQATMQVQASGIGPGVPLQDTQQTTPTNYNAPPGQAYQLAGGGAISILLVPSGYTVSKMMLMPIVNGVSTNAKSVTTSGGTPILTGWTDGSITVPVVAGGSVYIQSAGVETLAAAFR